MSGVLNQSDTPPILIGTGVTILIQWVAFVFEWRRSLNIFFDRTGSGTFISIGVTTIILSRSNLGVLDVALTDFRLQKFDYLRPQLSRKPFIESPAWVLFIHESVTSIVDRDLNIFAHAP